MQNKCSFLKKKKTIIVSEKQNNFLSFVGILFTLFIDNIWFSNQERSLFLFRSFKNVQVVILLFYFGLYRFKSKP